MAQQDTIVAFDGAATPVNRSFTADGIERIDSMTSLATWREAYANATLEAQAKISLKKQRLKSGTVVQVLDVSLPILETPSGGTPEGYAAPPRTAYTDRVVIMQYQSPRSNTTSRRTARQLALNIAGNVQTSVTPQTSGVVPLAFDYAIFPS